MIGPARLLTPAEVRADNASAANNGLYVVMTQKDFATHPIHEWVPEVCARTIVVTPVSVRTSTSDEVCERFAGWVSTPDYEGPWTEYRVAGLLEELNVRALAVISEFDVLRAARLRELSGLPGQRTASAFRYRDKYVMKRIAGRAGIRIPRMTVLRDAADLSRAATELGLPLVVKPRRMAGSEGVSVLQTRDAVAALASQWDQNGPPASFMGEEYVDAPLYHVDGLMLGGQVAAAWVSQYDCGNAETMSRRCVLRSHVVDDSAASSALLAVAKRVIAALNSPPHVLSFHAELFWSGEGEPVLCEIACRTGGAGVNAAVQAISGVNLRKESIRGQLGLPSTYAGCVGVTPAAGWTLVPPGVGTVLEMPPSTALPWVVELHTALKVGSVCLERQHMMQGTACITVSGGSVSQVQERIAEGERWWQDSIRWEGSNA